jgi:flagellar FliL protein
VIVLIVTIMIVECGLAYWFFGSAAPHPAESAEIAADPHAEKAEEEAHDDGEAVELSLGQFDVTAYQPTSTTTLRVSFQLYGTMKASDEETVKTMIEERKHRFREQILEIVRSSEINDLTDPVLGLIKRKILEKTNRLLGKPLVKGIVFSEFSYYEQ